jgi:cytochrome c
VTDVADLVADVVRLRPASFRYYVSSAAFKAYVDSWAPLLEEVRAELRALQMPERMVEDRLRGVVGRTLEGAERAAAEDAARMQAVLHDMERAPVRVWLDDQALANLRIGP